MSGLMDVFHLLPNITVANSRSMQAPLGRKNMSLRENGIAVPTLVVIAFASDGAHAARGGSIPAAPARARRVKGNDLPLVRRAMMPSE